MLTFERLTNLRAAVGFVVSPVEHVRALRDKLRSATRSVLPNAQVKDSSSIPHVTIAYPIFQGMSERAVATAETVGAMHEGFDAVVSEAVMVELERRGNLYLWQVVARIPLRGYG